MGQWDGLGPAERVVQEEQQGVSVLEAEQQDALAEAVVLAWAVVQQDVLASVLCSYGSYLWAYGFVGECVVTYYQAIRFVRAMSHDLG